jgi:hypothetical protein
MKHIGIFALLHIDDSVSQRYPLRRKPCRKVANGLMKTAGKRVVVIQSNYTLYS